MTHFGHHSRPWTDDFGARGYREYMTEVQGHLRVGPWEESDADRVVRVLHRSGPLPLRDLGQTPDLADWPNQRIQHAVVTAWSRNLIFVDTSDQLVAL